MKNDKLLGGLSKNRQKCGKGENAGHICPVLDSRAASRLVECNAFMEMGSRHAAMLDVL